MINPKELKILEEYFAGIQNKKSVEPNIRGIERTLNRLFDATFHVTIIPSSHVKTVFFGMNIYPCTSTVDLLVDSLMSPKSKSKELEEIWKKCDEWFIEIDDKLIYDKTLDANPQEMVAVLLHEIGHTIYANSVPARLHKVVNYKILKSGYRIQELYKNPKFSKLFDIVVVSACESKNFSYIDTKKEVDADKFVVQAGYGQALDSFITKMIMASNNDLVNRTDKDVEGDIAVITEWSMKTLSMLEIRKEKLRKELEIQEKVTTSPYGKNIFKAIKNRFFGDETAGTAIVAEQQLIMDYRKVMAQESFVDFVSNIGKLKKVKQSDLDVIRVEMDRIETLDDKYYVLDLIYDKLNVINLGLEYYANDNTSRCSQSESTLKDYKKQLEEYRMKVLDMKIVDKQYGLFIKVPKGYEG